MRIRITICSIVLLAIIMIQSTSYRFCTYSFPSYNPEFPPPPGTPLSQIFKLSQNYPHSIPREEYPWTSINFRTSPQKYAKAVLKYCLAGNIAIGFRVQKNTTRKWYHAPWLHDGDNGREWRHGLTRERVSPAGTLHPSQTSSTASWAVGFYNAPGGYTIRRIWPDCAGGPPDPSRANFPEGTVSFKLLFTTANKTQVPFLRNAFTWLANIRTSGSQRLDDSVRLLQIDIAVKDRRSPVGWVFGTFIYDGFMSGSTPWDRMRLVGLIWGNDSAVTSHINDTGAFINSDLHQTWINPAVISGPLPGARVYHLGLGGRLNGPIDNPISSCISCHGKAGVLNDPPPIPENRLGRNPRMVPSGTTVATYSLLQFGDYFGTNIPAGAANITYNCFISGLESCSSPSPTHVFRKTDYSLQIAVGIRNYYASLPTVAGLQKMTFPEPPRQ
ncbi:MAG: hypothetical protein QM731_00045 [Chitinophagaceae bacterium]